MIPRGSRQFFSQNTHRIYEALGAKLLDKAPSTPHCAVSVAYVAGWDRHLKKTFRDDIRAAMLQGEKPPGCRPAQTRDVWLWRVTGVKMRSMQKKGLRCSTRKGRLGSYR